MKSSAENEDKSELLKKCAASELHQKFAIKHINSLICASYLTTFVIALALTSYIHYAGVHQSREIQISIEKFMESELLKHKQHISKIKESPSG